MLNKFKLRSNKVLIDNNDRLNWYLLKYIYIYI